MSETYNFNVKVIRTKRKTTQIQIVDEQVIIRTNYSTRQQDINRLLTEHHQWIDKKIQASRQRKPVFKLLGKDYELVIVESQQVSYRLSGDSLYCHIKDQEDLQFIYDEIYYQHQDLLVAIIKECINNFPEKPKGVKIKRLHRSFGICRINREISISLYVLKYSQDFMKMIVYHELCHLKEMNHSIQFYNLLGQYVPNHRALRKEARGSK